jgi:hypothetical protein
MALVGGSAELKDLAAVIQRDIYTRNPNVRWHDVAGLDEAKRLLKARGLLIISTRPQLNLLLLPLIIFRVTKHRFHSEGEARSDLA